MIARVGRLYVFEWRKLLARRLPLVAFVGVLLVALVAPQIGRVVNTAASLTQGKVPQADKFANGWMALGGAVSTARLFLVIVLLLLAGSSVAEEGSQGTLQALLVRPVRRIEILIAKALALWSYGALLLVSTVAVAALSAELSQGLYDVVDPDYPTEVFLAFGDMWTYVFKASAITLAPLVALTTLGLMVSTLIEHPGYATGVAIGALFFLSALSGLSEMGKELLFVQYLGMPFEVVKDLAAQFSHIKQKFDAGPVARAVAIPLVWSALFFAVTAVALQRRDVVRGD